MEKLAIIEVLDRDGRSRSTHPVVQWPVTVGRGINNDLVLDDPHVAEHHFTLDASEDESSLGQHTASVAPNTINGLHIGRKHYPAGSALTLQHGSEWQAGTTRLRLRLAGAAEPAEQALEKASWWTWMNPAVALVLIVLIDFLSAYLNSSDNAFVSRALYSAAPTLLALGIWAMLWAIVSKIFRHRMYFWRHIGIAAWAALCIWTVDYVLAGLSFALSWSFASKLQNEVPWLILAITIWIHLRLVLQNRRRWLLTGYGLGLAAIAIVTITGALRFNETGRWWPSLYNGTIGPSWLRVAPTVPVDTFIEQTRQMQATLQEQAKVAEQEGDSAEDESFEEGDPSVE